MTAACRAFRRVVILAALLSVLVVRAEDYYEVPVVLPHGDWSILFSAAARKFATRTNIVMSSGSLPALPTSTNGLVAGDLWRDGVNLKVME